MLIIGVVVLAVLAAGGFYFWFTTRNIEVTDDAYTDGRAIIIAPRVSGEVVSLDVNDNQFVKQGQPLVHIDPRQYQIDREQAEGALATAKAQYRGQQYGLDVAKKNFPAQLEAAKAQPRTGQGRPAARSQGRLRSPEGAAEGCDLAAGCRCGGSGAEAGEAQVALADAQITQNSPVPERIGETDAAVSQLKGQVEQARARLDQADLNLSWAVVNAPQDGWITKRNVEKGSLRRAGPANLFHRRARSVDHRQLQGEPARRHAAPASMSASGSMPIRTCGWRDMSTASSWLRLEVHRLPAGERHRQLHQDRAARAGEDRPSTGGLDPQVPLPLGISVEPTVHGAMSDTAAAGPAEPKPQAPKAEETWKPAYNPWADRGHRHVGAFMEILDTTIVNVALPHIAGSLSSSNDEATWALTSYLVANGIVLTISGWLGDPLGAQALLHHLHCDVHGLLVFVRHCAEPQSAHHLPPDAGILRRRPCNRTSNPSSSTIFRRRAAARPSASRPSRPLWRRCWARRSAVIITDQFSWRWIFFLNVPVGAPRRLLRLYPGRRSAVGKESPQPRHRLYRTVPDHHRARLSRDHAGPRREDADWFQSDFIRGDGAARFPWDSRRNRLAVDREETDRRSYGVC